MSSYTGLHFSITALRKEVSALCVVAKKFIEPSCHYLLDAWSRDLQSLEASNAMTARKWLIANATPIRTKLTNAYEPAGRAGGHQVWGELCFVWVVNRISTPSAVKEKHLCLSGNASTKIRICENIRGKAHILAQWQIEVGAADSPGWHFHVGLTSESEHPPYPQWLPVPRVPGVLVLPTDGLDFLLGEVFQAEWRAAVSVDCYETQYFGNAQRERIEKWCRWQSQLVQAGHGSRWSRLKHGKPPADLFLT